MTLAHCGRASLWAGYGERHSLAQPVGIKGELTLNPP